MGSPASPGSVALFIDYEYVVYGALNKGCRVPGPVQLASIGTRSGRLVEAKAFADFGDEQMQQYGDELVTASIEQINCSADKRPDGQPKPYTDFYMLDHICEPLTQTRLLKPMFW